MIQLDKYGRLQRRRAPRAWWDLFLRRMQRRWKRFRGNSS